MVVAWMGLALVALSAPQQAVDLGRSEGVAASVEAASGGGAAGVSSALATTTVLEGRDGLEVSATYQRTWLVQGELVRAYAAGTLAADSVVRIGDVVVDGAATGWLDGTSLEQLGGFVRLRAPAGRGLRWSVALSRDPIWRGTRGVDPLRGIRVRDLRRLERDLTATELRGSAEIGVGRGLAGIEAGATRYGDGNRRAFVALASRLPLSTTRGAHLLLLPSLYAETFTGATGGFFSPSGFASVGLGLRAAGRLGRVDLETELHPHVFAQEGRRGVGASGQVRVGLRVRGAVVTAATEFLRQPTHGYVQLIFGMRLAG